MTLWIEGPTALVIAAIMFATSLFRLKGDHLGDDPLAVRVGAVLQGLLYGGVVAFVMLPLRLQLMQNGFSPGAEGTLRPPAGGYNAWLGALALIWVLRSGVIARAPLIGHPFRAYRLASLRQSVAMAQGRIARLEALDAPKQKVS